MDARVSAIRDFASVLRDVRSSSGNPPFREMSGRSGAISHTTLYEAAKGNRLPSWETTVEFVKACGGDPADYRERWEQANRAVRGASAEGDAGPASQSGENDSSARPPSDASAEEARPGPGKAPERGRAWLSAPVKAALATTAVGVGIAGVIAVSGDRGSGAGQQGVNPLRSTAEPVPGPADCPVLTPNPPTAPPAHPGDLAVFVADVTLIDCARVAPGVTVTKVWRLQNAGTVPWNGYSLRRLDSPQQVGRCQTITDVPIDDTPPGEMVDIRVDVTTQKTPGLCYVLFKMVDAGGRIAFPATRPANFQIIVDPRAPAARDAAGAS
ncbi:NBR1-Ig-like domain-containing protein [Actinocorallia libanotica]|uniref:Nbr1 FW domain-containing protein n=1 Tax=Actinocorallia libanotica TaxID=46162 RepID=A0ABN1QQZ6_9ACTN